MGFLREHFAEITLCWFAVFLIGMAVALSFFPTVDRETVSWIRGLAGGFGSALLLSLKTKGSGGITSDTQTTNTATTNVDKTIVEPKKEGGESNGNQA